MDKHCYLFSGRLPKAIFMLGLFIVVITSGLRAQTHSDYNGSATVTPGEELSVELDMDFVPNKETSRLQFLLHGDLEVVSLDSDQMKSYDIEQGYKPYDMDTAYVQLITVELDSDIADSDAIDLHWEYRGKYNNDHFQLGPSASYKQWTELEIGSLWLPTVSNFRHPFNAELSVNVPEEYMVVGSGSVKKDGNRWHLQSHSPDVDFPLITSNEMQIERHQSGQNNISVYHKEISDELGTYVSDSAIKILSFYKQTLGDNKQESTLRIVVPPSTRARDMAYARPQLIVLEEDSKPDSNTFDLIAHEAGHLWWSHARDTQSKHNFMNEAFASYSAYLAVRKFRGEEVFQRKIDTVREDSKKLPGFDEWSPDNNRPLTYKKGAYLLYQLHNRMGDEKFYHFLQTLHQEQTGTIDDMLKVLEQQTDADTASWFEDKLYN